MPYNFDELIDRGPNSKTYSMKWQGYENRFPEYEIDVPNMLPMWVADMDFRCPDEVKAAICARAEHAIYGYASEDANHEYRKAAIGWFARRYGWNNCKAEWMLFSPGVVPAINTSIQAFTKEGEGVIIQPPVYYPFAAAVHNNNRTLVNNPLKEVEGHYEIDFENLESVAREPSNKLIVLCNPHNPVGRVWSREELYRVCKICHENHVIVFCDEIHGDLVMPGHKLCPAGSMEEFHDKMILAHSASKTFNLAGLAAALITVPDERLRQRLAQRMFANRLPSGNTFGPIAGAAAYRYGDAYADELIKYIEANVEYADAYLKKHLPYISIVRPEGTYMVWVDFRRLNMDEEALYHTILEKAKIAGDLGKWFGAGGEKFLRLNFACPRSRIDELLGRLRSVFQ